MRARDFDSRLAIFLRARNCSNRAQIGRTLPSPAPGLLDLCNAVGKNKADVSARVNRTGGKICGEILFVDWLSLWVETPRFRGGRGEFSIVIIGDRGHRD